MPELARIGWTELLGVAVLVGVFWTISKYLRQPPPERPMRNITPPPRPRPEEKE